jgi:hypothetical protein
VLKPYKFIITPICQNVATNGDVLGEEALTNDGQPIVVYGIKALTEFAAKFQAELDQINQPQPEPKKKQ